MDTSSFPYILTVQSSLVTMSTNKFLLQLLISSLISSLTPVSAQDYDDSSSAETDTDSETEAISETEIPKTRRQQTPSPYFAQTIRSSVKFRLFSDRDNPLRSKKVIYGDVHSMKQIRVGDVGSSLKIVIHGFNTDSNGKTCQKLKTAFLASTRDPVVCIDWGSMSGATSPIGLLLYSDVADKNVPQVGPFVGEFIADLMKQGIIPSLDKVHIIGHSLGAHMAGIAGRTVKELLGGEKVGRITGLDPAGPSFEEKGDELRLDPEDAKYVDVVHTSDVFGAKRTLGHVDYFPNSDEAHQPGCSGLASEICDHRRAVDFYVTSITNKELFGCIPAEEQGRTFRRKKCSETCDKNVVFGEYSNSSTRGQFCLKIEHHVDGIEL